METRSNLWLLIFTYPLSFFAKDMAGFELAKAQLSSSAATAGDNDKSHPLKSCKGQCLLLLVKTVGKKQQHPKVGDTPYSFQHISPIRI